MDTCEILAPFFLLVLLVGENDAFYKDEWVEHKSSQAVDS